MRLCPHITHTRTRFWWTKILNTHPAGESLSPNRVLDYRQPTWLRKTVWVEGRRRVWSCHPARSVRAVACDHKPLVITGISEQNKSDRFRLTAGSQSLVPVYCSKAGSCTNIEVSFAPLRVSRWPWTDPYWRSLFSFSGSQSPD